VASDHDIFDRRLLTRRRNRAAGNAASHGYLLEQVADDIIARLGAINRSFPVALNLGAHHGLLGRRLRGVRGVEMVIDADPAALLLAQCDGPRVRADEELLPFADTSLDLVVSGLALHMVNDLPGTLVQIRRALKPGGLLLAAALGGNTLSELRHSLLIAEEESDQGASPRVAPFADIRQFGALLQRANFALPVADSLTLTVTYANATSLMRELRAMGASNVLHARRRVPLRRSILMRAVARYSEEFGLAYGRVPATFEIITMTGWASHARAPQSVDSGPPARARSGDASLPALR
jgi:NADH dehydrogenase [ubiquinone] 1 alpha subcomplex assembly factor 5